jgi:putative ABC transport system permease protein
MMRRLAVVLAVQMAASTPVLSQQRPMAPSAAQPVVTSPVSRPAAPRPIRTVAIDERLAEDAHLAIGDRIVIAGQPGVGAAGGGDTVIISAIVSPRADPSEVARDDYRLRLHLTDLLKLTGAGDRVDRFAVRTDGGDALDRALARINASAFGFHAYRSADVAVGTSKTFQVVSRFHRAIAVITITASALFLLCILILRVDERRRDIAALRLIGISGASVVWSVVIEAALISLVGSAVGTGIGYVTALAINWHYRGVHRPPLAFARVTPGIVALAVGIAIVLGLGAGFLASARMVRVPPLTLFGR